MRLSPKMVIEVATIRTWTWNRATASFDTFHQRLVAPRISCSGTTDLEAHGVKRESPIWYSWSDGDASGAYELIPDSGKMSTTRARGLLPCLRRVHLHNGHRRILPNNFVLCFFFFFDFLETCEGILSWKFPLCETTDLSEWVRRGRIRSPA